MNGNENVMSLNLSRVFSIALLLLVTVGAGGVQAAQIPAGVPPAVVHRYSRLSNALQDLATKPKAAVAKKLHADIQAFYQQQRTRSSGRRLLAGSLYLQALLAMPDHATAYTLVTELLSLRLETEQRLNFQLVAGQLSASNENWSAAADHLEAWLTAVSALAPEDREKYHITLSQQARNYHLLSQVYYQQSDFKKALTPARLAYQTALKNESYLRQLLSVLEQLEDKPAVHRLLTVAVVDFPDGKDYWERLGYSYLQREQPEPALATLAIARRKLLLNQQGWRVLASLYLSQLQPRAAAGVYIDGVANGMLIKDQQYYQGLVNAWVMAREREKALSVYQEAAVTGIEINNGARNRAQLFYLEGRWAEAEAAYRMLADADRTEDKWRFMQGICQVEQGKDRIARATFAQIKGEKYRAYAGPWLAQLPE